MTARDVANVLSQIETLLELGGDDFKSKAYGRAARALEASMIDIEGIVRSGEAIKVPGVGAALGAEVKEIVETGTTPQLEELRKSTPPGLLDMLKIRGLGAKKVRAIHLQLGISTLEELEEAARQGRIAPLPGFGEKSQAKILAGIEDIRRNESRLRINQATEIGEAFLAILEGLPSVERASVAGRLRRGAEEYDALSFVVQGSSIDDVERDLVATGQVSDPAREGRRITCITQELIQVKIDVASAASFHAVLHQRTGASDYAFMISIPLHDRGYDLREDGLYKGEELVELQSEEELFELAGAQYIIPELREGIDEVRRALDGRLPEFIRREDLRGMMHVHSTWSDGRSSIAEIAAHVHDLGYEYLLITDHSKTAFYANGLDEHRLEAQGKEIDEINAMYDPDRFRILKGIECDILADGSLDLADDALAALDAVVISVHSSFTLPMDAQTERICRALEHPHSTILGHSTGRLILKRKGYDVDLRQVIDTAAHHGKTIELNCNPMRLDLNWRMIRYARRRGVTIAINPDAHSLADFNNMRYGIMMARKAGLTKEETLNTRSWKEIVGSQ